MEPQEFINVFLPKNLWISLGFWETPTYPSLKLTLTLSSHLEQNDGLEEGRWAASQKPKFPQTYSVSDTTKWR